MICGYIAYDVQYIAYDVWHITYDMRAYCLIFGGILPMMYGYIAYDMRVYCL